MGLEGAPQAEVETGEPAAPTALSQAERAGVAALMFVAALGAATPAGADALEHAGPAAEVALPILAAPEKTLPIEGLFQAPGQSDDKDNKHESKDISAIACATPLGARRLSCLLVADDVRYVRPVTVHKGAIKLGDPFPLVADDLTGEGVKDIDAEGAAFLSHNGHSYYYVTGSHGAPREPVTDKGDRKPLDPLSFFVFRIEVDPETGALTQVKATGALETAVAEVGKEHGLSCTANACQALGAGGPNIEGLAARDGQLYFGFRAPTQAGRAFVVRVSADGLFGEGEARAEPELLKVRLGGGFGIRDLVAVDGGFLVLAGVDGTPNKTFAYPSLIHFWDGRGEETQPLAVLATAERRAKPEALLVLDDDHGAGRYRVLVLSDGVKGGAPAVYTIPRPKTP